MIAFWNRKEVLLATTLQRFNEARGFLKEKGIPYTYRVTSNYPDRLGPFSSTPFNLEYSKLYYVYVHKKDFELASAVIDGKV
jgi:hypothetical protein